VGLWDTPAKCRVVDAADVKRRVLCATTRTPAATASGNYKHKKFCNLWLCCHTLTCKPRCSDVMRLESAPADPLTCRQMSEALICRKLTTMDISEDPTDVLHAAPRFARLRVTNETMHRWEHAMPMVIRDAASIWIINWAARRWSVARRVGILRGPLWLMPDGLRGATRCCLVPLAQGFILQLGHTCHLLLLRL